MTMPTSPKRPAPTWPKAATPNRCLTNQIEMLRCAATLRGTQPLDLDDLRNRYPKKAAAVRGKQKPGTEVTGWETV